MTLEIRDFKLDVVHTQVLDMPKGSKILTAQVTDGSPYIWAAVDAEADFERRVLITYGTGNPVREITLFPYVGTYQLEQDGIPFPLSFHVFDGGVAA